MNIEQRAEYTKTMASIMPTLIRGSHLFVLTGDLAWRPLVPEEYMAIQGLPAFEVDGTRLRSALTIALLDHAARGTFSRTKFRSMLGNGMHHASVGSVLLDALLRTHVHRPE